MGEKVEYDPFGGMYIWGKGKNGELQMIMDIQIRGWGAIQNMFDDLKDAEEFQNEVGRWIADAINKKLGSNEVQP